MGFFARAEINEPWAEQVAEGRDLIERYNNRATVAITRGVDLRQLGGLTVVCIEAIRDRDYIAVLRKRGLLVLDLAFGEPGKLTTTSWLAQAAKAENPDLAEALTVRDGWVRPMGDMSEQWLLPADALHIVSTEGVEQPTVRLS